jgi:4-methylaminobutanoate oxidase (formaldehyde-forming)
MATARPFRRSPVHHLLTAANANFGSRMGWERPNFAPAGASPQIEYTWGKPNWLPWSAAEQTAARTAVAVFDQPRSRST